MPFASRLYGACPGRSNGWSRRSRRQKWRDVKDIPPYLAWVEGGRGRRNSKCDSPNHTLPFPCHLVPRIKYFATTARSLVWSSSLAVRSVIAPAAQADARHDRRSSPFRLLVRPKDPSSSYFLVDAIHPVDVAKRNGQRALTMGAPAVQRQTDKSSLLLFYKKEAFLSTPRLLPGSQLSRSRRSRADGSLRCRCPPGSAARRSRFP